MKSHTVKGPWEGECATEICLSVKMRYRVAADGEVEVTEVTLEPTSALPKGVPLLWPHLPLAERRALQTLAEEEVDRVGRERGLEP